MYAYVIFTLIVQIALAPATDNAHLGHMNNAHKVAISISHSHHPMLVRARARGIGSLTVIQERLTTVGYPVSKAFLSQVMNRRKPCPPRLRDLLENMTGWRIGER